MIFWGMFTLHIMLFHDFKMSEPESLNALSFEDKPRNYSRQFGTVRILHSILLKTKPYMMISGPLGSMSSFSVIPNIQDR